MKNLKMVLLILTLGFVGAFINPNYSFANDESVTDVIENDYEAEAEAEADFDLDLIDLDEYLKDAPMEEEEMTFGIMSKQLKQKESNIGGMGGALPKGYYSSIKKAPKYPAGFKATKNGKKNYTVNNKGNLEKLRKVRSGTWHKVYHDGNVGKNQRSIHYYQHSSGVVTDVKVKTKWSHAHLQ